MACIFQLYHASSASLLITPLASLLSPRDAYQELRHPSRWRAEVDFGVTGRKTEVFRRPGGTRQRDGKRPLSGRNRQSTGVTNNVNDGSILLSVLVTSVIDWACTRPKP